MGWVYEGDFKEWDSADIYVLCSSRSHLTKAAKTTDS